jgi:hypothetical protein
VRCLYPTIALTLILGVSLCASAWAHEYPDVQIISQSETDITLRYRPAALTWSADAQGEFPEIERTGLNRRDGFPPVPGRIIYVAVPPNTESAGAYVTSAGETQAGRHESLRAPQDADAAAYPYPSAAVEVAGVFTLRGMRVARLIINPLQILTADGDYQFTTELTVRVTFIPKPGPPPSRITAAGFEPQNPFGDVLHSLLINPERITTWRIARTSLQAAAAATDTDPFAGSDSWIALHFKHEGIARITADMLTAAGIDLASSDPRNYRVFAGPGRMLSTKMSDPPPALREIPIAITGGDDGSFDSGDAFEFYVQALNRWEIDENGNFADVVHRYDDENVCWLALDGDFSGSPARLETAPALQPSPEAPAYFSAKVRVRNERDLILRVAPSSYIESYYTWYWSNAQNTNLSMAGVDRAGDGAPARIELASRSQTANLYDDGELIEPETTHLGAGEDGSRITTFALPSFDPQDTYTLRFDSSAYDEYYLDYYSIDYQRELTLSGGPFRFPSPDTNAAVTLVIANVTAPQVWDVTDPFAPVLLEPPAPDGNVIRFGLDQSQGQRSEFYVCEPEQRISPVRMRQVTRNDLYQPLAGADYVIVGPRAFEPAMADYMAYRSAADGLSFHYAAVEDIYDGFSLGVFDPIAIRRFLRHTFIAWPAPAPVYALLLGDGNYAFLNNTNAGAPNYVPPYIVPNDESASDENYVYFGDRQVLNIEEEPENPFPDMLIGRWPVRSTAEIRTLTDKVKSYESSDDLGQWRSRVLVMADDEFGDREAVPPSVAEIFHTRDSEEIVDGFIPPRFDVHKIYMTEFPFDNPGCREPGARGCRKPAVNEALVAELNDGVAVFNFLGHGNKNLLTHERVFERTVELPALTNVGRPTAVFTFSCSIGFFDDPNGEGMAEEWVRMPGGAIAVISATRVVFAGANEALNKKFLDLLLNEERLGLGASLYTAKLLRQYGGACQVCREPPCPCNNDRRYILMGDPAMKLGVPRNRVDFTAVEPESLSALELTQVTGTVVDTLGVVISDFNGEVLLTVQDTPRLRTYRVNDNVSVDYNLPGGTLYRGKADVVNGEFEFGFIVPKDVAYGTQGAKILAHAIGGDAMAGGVADSLRIVGSAGTIADTTGPAIELETAEGEVVTDGFALTPGTEIIVRLSDSSGINLTGATGHRIEVFMTDTDEPLADLTESFAYDGGQYHTGMAQFTLPDLATGLQRLSLRAWDNANNSSLLTVELDITDTVAEDEFRISEFLNYPNPFTDETTFYFRATREIRNARIRVFTLAGRMIWEYIGAADGITTWSGADLAGDPVGNGVYLAQIEASGRVGPESQTVDKKAYKEIKVVLAR